MPQRQVSEIVIKEKGKYLPRKVLSKQNLHTEELIEGNLSNTIFFLAYAFIKN